MSNEVIVNATKYHERLEQQRDKSKFKAFGKVSFRPKKRELDDLENVLREKNNILDNKNLRQIKKLDKNKLSSAQISLRSG